MINVIVCDDEEKILHRIVELVEKKFLENNILCEVRATADSRELIKIMEEDIVDVLFLDIDMPYYNGMDIAGYINKNKLKTMIIFVTSHDALVYQTFEYRPFGFVRKSYVDEEITQLIKRIAAELDERKEEIAVIRGQEITRIAIKDIVYIEAFGNYLNIRTDKEEIRKRETMTSMENELKGKGFIRCHKGYLVNGNHIVKLGSGELEVEYNGYINTVPVGRSYEKDVKRGILELLRN